MLVKAVNASLVFSDRYNRCLEQKCEGKQGLIKYVHLALDPDTVGLRFGSLVEHG